MMLVSSQSLREVFEQALLARAAYADLSGIQLPQFANTALLEQDLTNVLGAAAARYVAERFGVVHHQPNTFFGYSGTLFARRDAGDPAEVSDDYTFAFRGTETDLPGVIQDLLLADILQIGLAGQADLQRAAMLSHWDEMTNGAVLPSSIREALLAQDVNVTGHSLGGHLATVFLDRRRSSVRHAYQFNTPGAVIPDLSRPGNASVPFVMLAEALGLRPEVFSDPDSSNFIGDTIPDAISGVATLYGTVDRIFEEEEGLVASTLGIDEHSMLNMVFGVASTYLLSLIDATLDESSSSLATVNRVLRSVTNEGADSYERFASVLQPATTRCLAGRIR